MIIFLKNSYTLILIKIIEKGFYLITKIHEEKISKWVNNLFNNLINNRSICDKTPVIEEKYKSDIEIKDDWLT